ncbi:MAG TPA: beta-ketoacyl synthase N-terminal-like domain-containing protein [Thermoanaerobaculia bacterium]|nr:beta-ketoacyl synthase N-terminal-like domain-containing protein [Thermoanaerobaculia bacterium]
MNPTVRDTEAIAVIGLSVRLPGASDAHAFWRNLRDGVECISFFDRNALYAEGVDRALLDDPRYVRARGVIEDVDRFDAGFFGYGRREAEVTDPQQRVYLECAWQAIEDAGHDPERFDGRIASFAGVGMNTYLFNTFGNEEVRRTVSPYQLMIANDKDFLSTRISYKLNLRGPSLTVQCGCSTSLVAVHLAMQSLFSGESDMAIAGGVSIRIPQNGGYLYQESGIFSPDGHCRAFDEQSRGTVSSSGAGVVVLRRLSDAVAAGDHIRAILLASAINNDGSAKAGFTAPSVEGQTAVISEAMAMAGVDADSISYVEAHGTGTILGDPIEITALTRAFGRGTSRRNFCAIGSVKTNIGHTDAASGVAGLIKTVLALEHRELPPSLHYTAPNPRIDFASTPFFVNAARRDWKSDGPLRAGVSSFGIGGTNAHVVLEEAPAPRATSPSRPLTIVPLSARSAAALDAVRANVTPHLGSPDVAFTLATGRKQFAFREYRVGDGPWVRGEAAEHHRPVTFLFSGEVAGDVRELYAHEPAVREVVDAAAKLLRRQPDARESAFINELAVARLWIEWGLTPESALGEGVGALVAAVIEGHLTMEVALPRVADATAPLDATRLAELQRETARVFIEIGSVQPTYASMLDALGRLWIAGVRVDWHGFYAHEQRRRVPLPTYPFERQRYWIGSTRGVEQTVVRDQAGTAPAAPQSTEEAVATIWRALLGSDVRPHDNLLDAGASSLMAVQAMNKIRETFGVTLPAAAVYELTTVAEQAAHIDRERRADFSPPDDGGLKPTDPLQSPLVPIQPDGTRRPLFCVHPAGGIVLCYAELADRLGNDQPLYGLQSPAVYGGSEPATIEERATQYIEALRGVQRHGPYQLAGLSYGGNVAFEMARQLHAAGESVTLLALLDSHPPVSYGGSGTPDVARFREGFVRMIRAYGFGAFLGIGPDGTLSETGEHFFRLWHGHHLSLRSYQPRGRYADRITYFRAQAPMAGDLAQLLDIRLEPGVEREWGRLSTEALEIVDVPGDHLTMVAAPHVDALAEKLRAVLERAEVLA